MNNLKTQKKKMKYLNQKKVQKFKKKIKKLSNKKIIKKI